MTTTRTTRTIDTRCSIDKIMKYESGELDEKQIIELFQGLIDTGLVFRLQGSYGRTAQYLIESDYCTAAT